jgi:hypothetical protein
MVLTFDALSAAQAYVGRNPGPTHEIRRLNLDELTG